jgi:Ca2+:H+ antiporter
MSATDTIDQSSGESQPLLNGDDHDSSSQPRSNHGPPVVIDLAAHVYLVSKEALKGYTYFLLGFVPIGIVIGALQLNPIATSILNLVAIIPLSALVSHSSDLLSDRVGELIGGLINATFGNAVELIVCLFPF